MCLRPVTLQDPGQAGLASACPQAEVIVCVARLCVHCALSVSQHLTAFDTPHYSRRLHSWTLWEGRPGTPVMALSPCPALCLLHQLRVAKLPSPALDVKCGRMSPLAPHLR